MNKKLYYAIVTPLIIIGFIFPASITYLLPALILVVSYSGWKDYRRKLKKAEGEKDIQHAVVPSILVLIAIVLLVISLIV